LKLEVAIITRDRAAILPKALDSALSQACADVGVRVFDDASSDGMSALSGRYPGVRWERGEVRLGIPAARQKLLRETEAEYLCNLDDDAWFLAEDALATAVAFLDANPGVAVAGFDVVAPGREGRRDRGEPVPSHTFPGCAHVLRVSAAREVGGFAAFPGLYGCEEKDLALRLLDAGHEVVTLVGVHAWHDKTPEARDVPALHASGVCNDLVWVLRRYPFPDVCWGVPAKVFGHLVFASRVGMPRACLRGIGMCLRALPIILATREPVKRATMRKYRERASVGPRAYDRLAWAAPPGVGDQGSKRNAGATSLPRHLKDAR
jgi:GT2 family glycosyltransferase